MQNTSKSLGFGDKGGPPEGYDPRVIDEIVRALSRVRHGYVQITLQDARVVQIDILEKKRLER